jgi:hypothetical protein
MRSKLYPAWWLVNNPSQNRCMMPGAIWVAEKIGFEMGTKKGM